MKKISKINYKSSGLPKVTFLAEAEAEFEGGKKFGLRPIIEAEAEGGK